MAASWKYFGLRVVNAVMVLCIVIFIISALFSQLAEDQVRTDIHEKIRGEIAGSDELKKLNATELQNYKEGRQEQLEEQYGLDRPLWYRILDRTGDTLRLDFGNSHVLTGPGGTKDVMEIIMSRLPRTILLFTTAAFFYVALGLMVGLKAAQVAGTNLDKFLSVFGMTTTSMPMWWLGMLAILVFSYQLNWFPAAAYPFPDKQGAFDWSYYRTVLWRMVLPVSVITFNLFGGRAWATRNIVTDVLQDDYITAARAKGVPERKVIYGHTLKTAAPPVVTSAILTFLLSIGGAMITEIIFNWPGLGRLTYSAIWQNDVPVVMGVVFISTFLYILGYLLADLIYGFLDPRVEVGVEKAV